MSTSKAALKAAYQGQQLPLAVLAAMHGVNARTAQRWKAQDLKQGEDWDKGRAAVLLTGDTIETTARDTLGALIAQFKSAIEMMQNDPALPAVEKVQHLASLSDALHKAVAANKKLMPQAARLAIAVEVIKKLTAFVSAHFPNEKAALLTVLKPFSEQLAREFA